MNKSVRLSFSFLLLTVTFFISLLLSSCSKASVEMLPHGAAASCYPLTVTDQTGRSVTIEQEPQRIVSGYYISTSILLALDLKDRLVGIEAKADKRPVYRLAAPQLIGLPNVGSAKQFDFEGCIALNPDLVILPRKLKDAAETLSGLGIRVLIVDPEDEFRLAGAVTLIGDAANRKEQAVKLNSAISAVMTDLSAKTASATRPRVLITGISSPLSAATGAMYQAKLIDLAGGFNVASELSDSSWAEISYEQLLEWDPQVIVLAGEAAYSVDDVKNDPNLSACTAVRNGNVYRFPSAAESLDSPVPAGIFGAMWLASVLHPDIISETDCLNSVQEFYRTFYGFEYSEN